VDRVEQGATSGRDIPSGHPETRHSVRFWVLTFTICTLTSVCLGVSLDPLLNMQMTAMNYHSISMWLCKFITLNLGTNFRSN
jgi:hypothetical protein